MGGLLVATPEARHRRIGGFSIPRAMLLNWSSCAGRITPWIFRYRGRRLEAARGETECDPFSYGRGGWNEAAPHQGLIAPHAPVRALEVTRTRGLMLIPILDQPKGACHLNFAQYGRGARRQR